MYMSTSRAANASNLISPSHSVDAQPLVTHDYFKGKTDKQILQDVSRQLNRHPEVASHKEYAARIEEKNELVADYEWKMHKLQVAARKPKPADLAVDNKFHPDWRTNKAHQV